MGEDGILARVILGIFCCGLSYFDRHTCEMCDVRCLAANVSNSSKYVSRWQVCPQWCRVRLFSLIAFGSCNTRNLGYGQSSTATALDPKVQLEYTVLRLDTSLTAHLLNDSAIQLDSPAKAWAEALHILAVRSWWAPRCRGHTFPAGSHWTSQDSRSPAGQETVLLGLLGRRQL